MSKFVEAYINRMADDLLKAGKRIVHEAIETRTYEHDTFNLHDSYGAAVFYNGKIIREYYPPQKATEPQLTDDGLYVYGSDDIKEYFRIEYVPEQGLELAVVASMWYGTELEKGKRPLKRKYKVISQIYSEMVELQKKYHANVIRIKGK